LVAAVLFMLLGPTAAMGQKKPKGNAQPGPAVTIQAGIAFSLHEREQIVAFFGERGPEGVKPLPPGIRKNLARGKPLPPGIAKKTLAPELIRLLPPRSGYDVVQVGWDVVLVEVATGIIHDVLMDVIR